MHLLQRVLFELEKLVSQENVFLYYLNLIPLKFDIETLFNHVPVSTRILLSCPRTASPIFDNLIMLGSNTSTLIGFPAVFCSLSST